MKEKVIIGRFGAPHGIKGWIRVQSHTDPIQNLLNYSPLFIEKNTDWEILAMEDGKPHQAGLIVKVQGIDTPEAARLLTHKNIAIDREKLPLLNNAQYYWADLIGLSVVNVKHEELGVIDSLMETGANDVIVVHHSSGSEILIPYIKSVVLSVDLEKKIMIVDWDIT